MTAINEVMRLLAFFVLVVCVICIIILVLVAWYLEKYVSHNARMSNEISKMLRKVY